MPNKISFINIMNFTIPRDYNPYDFINSSNSSVSVTDPYQTINVNQGSRGVVYQQTNPYQGIQVNTATGILSFFSSVIWSVIKAISGETTITVFFVIRYGI